MTSPREAVSILTAAALVVAPVGGVAATYTTGYAEDGGSHTTTAEGRTLPRATMRRSAGLMPGSSTNPPSRS